MVVGGGGEQSAKLHPGKGEAGAAAVGAGLASGGESQGEEGEEEAEYTERNTKVQVGTQV